MWTSPTRTLRTCCPSWSSSASRWSLPDQEAERLKQETAKIKQQNEEYQEQLRKEKEKAVESRPPGSPAHHRRSPCRRKHCFRGTESHAQAAGRQRRRQQASINVRPNCAGTSTRWRTSSAPPSPRRSAPKPTRGILVGDTVELLKLGTKASVLADQQGRHAISCKRAF